MKHIFHLPALCLGMSAMIVSCSDEVVFPEENSPGAADSDQICFAVSTKSASRGGSESSRRSGGAYLHSSATGDSIFMQLTESSIESNPGSRAAYITEDGYSTLRMTCLKRSAQGREYYFSNLAFTKGADGVWTSNPPYWWLSENEHFNFYGYAPADAKGASYVADVQDWQPKLNFVVPENVKDQSDLVYNSLTQEYVATANITVPLSLKHALANVAFKTGTGMAAGTINSVSIRNVVGSGSLNLATGAWTLNAADVRSFTAEVAKTSADATEVTTDTDATYFMLLPGSTSEGTTVEIEFTAADGSQRTYTGALNQAWEAGKQYMYTITVNPDLEITVTPETQDAHYVMCKTHVSAANLQAGKGWILEATASDGANVTLLNQINQYQQNGFWVDRVLFQANGSTTWVDQGSARGEKTLSGIGETDVYIFLPENVSEENRTITLSLKAQDGNEVVAETTFEQVCPDWTAGGYGWEQFENDPATTWGFLWNRVVTYRKDNFYWNALIYAPIIKDLVSQYNAGGYTSISQTWPLQHVTIEIDYRKLNNLTSLNLGTNNGLSNTQALYGYSGSATTGNLEAAIQALAEDRGNNGKFSITSESGTNDMASAALGYILRKNKYNWGRIEKIDNSNPSKPESVITESPIINTTDIVWFLPAVDQVRANTPTLGDPWEGEYWSSTPDGTENAFTSTGSSYRMPSPTTIKVRAAREKNN